MKPVSEIVNQHEFSAADLINLIQAEGNDRQDLYKKALSVKTETIGNKVFLRGLIEFSNRCAKNCFYCGIRKSNDNIVRYDITDSEILDASRFAWKNRFGSVVLQSGEVSSPAFVKRVEKLVSKIKQLSNNELGITLSCGEQKPETYRRWFEAGAHRYLLRIETSNRELYMKIHPHTKLHAFDRRLEALFALRLTGYQLGTGVMIGIPFQTIEDLAADLLFMKELNIDMCGMGPFIEHENTPLYRYRNELLTKSHRFDLALNMVAALRLLMPDINIAASTALQAIDTNGREKALAAGANIIMPNLTPQMYRDAYLLYEGKPFTNEDAENTSRNLSARIKNAGFEIGFGEWGDSKHFDSPRAKKLIWERE